MKAYRDYSVEAYGRMINDERRMDAFVAALQASIRPGDVVLDIGTGTGIFAFLAVRFGAARVYAVEPDAQALDVARHCAASVPDSERITWIEGLTTAIDLPERVDVAVGDLHGVLPFFRGNIASMIDARDRLLKPDGRLIPARDYLFAVPTCAPDEYQRVEQPWRRNRYGLDLSHAAARVHGQWWRAGSTPIAQDAQLAPPAEWGVVDYATGNAQELERRITWTVTRDGTWHGLHVWFDSELAHGIRYSNAPTLPEMIYGRAFFPAQAPVQVHAGDQLDVLLSARLLQGEYVFRWDSAVQTAGGVRKARFRQSTFQPPKPAARMIRSVTDDRHVAALSDEGHVALAILQGIAAGQPLRQIAEQVHARFPAHFADPTAAFDDVVRLGARYA